MDILPSGDDALTVLPGQENITSNERPLKTKKWEQAPEEKAGNSIRTRWREFFADESLPPKIRALGILTTEIMAQTSHDLGTQDFLMALNYGVPHGGEPTVYGMELYKDRLDVALSSVPGYGQFSLYAISLPLDELDQITGRVTGELVLNRPDIVHDLLSSEAGNNARCSAKVSLMRYLSQARPDSVKELHDMGGMDSSIALAYTIDGKTALAKLYIEEVPETDPVLGETVELYREIEAYRRLTGSMTNQEFDEMTTAKIEAHLKRMPEWIQKVIMGKYPDPGSTSFRIMSFLEKLGYKGSETQKKFRNTQKMSYGYHGFMSKLRRNIFRTIIEGCTPEEANLTPTEIDAMFKASYEHQGYYKLPEGFSLTSAVSSKTDLKDLGI